MKILFFSPYSLINVHCYPEAIVAYNMHTRGHQIIQVRCKGIYSEFCIAMSSVHLHPDSPAEKKAEICAACNWRRRSIESQFGFDTIYIDDYVTEYVKEQAQHQLEKITPDNWAIFEIDGIPISRYASYEYILNEKIDTLKFSNELWPGYIIHLKNALITFYASQIFIGQIKPDAIVAYNTVYSCNHMVCCVGDKQGIPNYTLHAGSHHKYMRSEITIFKGFKANSLINRSDAWANFSRKPLSRKSISKATEHIHELLEARSDWVYTLKAKNQLPNELRSFFDIKIDQKVVLVTMASGDERFAANLVDALPPYKPPIFETQIIWINKLIEWARFREDLFLIIRVHPREFPNKREIVLSNYAKSLRKSFNDLPENVRINWPDDRISLHDLIKITDVGLNATSTAGLELLLFGIPVVIYDVEQIFSYPREINSCATSITSYFEQIDRAISQGKSLKHIINAFRWIAFKSEIVSIDISDAYDANNLLKQITFLDRIKNVISYFFKKTESGLYVDPYMRREGLNKLKNNMWLSFAVENNQESHLNAVCKNWLATADDSEIVERQEIVRSMHVIFSRLGLTLPIDE